MNKPAQKNSVLLSRLIEGIERAEIYDLAIVSPLDEMARLTLRLNNTVWLKREDLQSVFSFKLRGAYNKMRMLEKNETQRGVITASAGNHAQGVALAARHLGIQSTIVMPETTPEIKISSVRRIGSEVVLHGDIYDEAYEFALQLSRQDGRVFVHPYDDIDVMSGQGTIAKEILAQMPKAPDAIFIPVGGGGLIAGMAAWVKEFSPQTRVIGVEPQDASTLYSALQHNERVILPQVGIFTDGVAVKQIGEHPFEVARRCVDEVILVTIDEICAAIKDIFDDTRVVAEPAGALAIAGLKKYVTRARIEQQNLVAINSGANINFDRLRHVAERAEIGEGHESLFAVTIPEEKGSFLKFCERLGRRSITEFNYRYADRSDAHIFVGIKLNHGNECKQRFLKEFSTAGYPILDISDNEMAKLHLRYMVGGRSHLLDNEHLYRFIFPERPGALLDFLRQMGFRWNISLFHYRNHGAAYGRVLVGVQYSEDEQSEFALALQRIGFAYFDETQNPAYELFLK